MKTRRQTALRILTAMMLSAAVALVMATACQGESPHPVIPADMYEKAMEGQEYINYETGRSSHAEKVINAMHELGYELFDSQAESHFANAVYIFRVTESHQNSNPGKPVNR